MKALIPSGVLYALHGVTLALILALFILHFGTENQGTAHPESERIAELDERLTELGADIGNILDWAEDIDDLNEIGRELFDRHVDVTTANGNVLKAVTELCQKNSEEIQKNALYSIDK